MEVRIEGTSKRVRVEIGGSKMQTSLIHYTKNCFNYCEKTVLDHCGNCFNYCENRFTYCKTRFTYNEICFKDSGICFKYGENCFIPRDIYFIYCENRFKVLPSMKYVWTTAKTVISSL